MSSGGFFNSLGQILARAGEIAVARAILRGVSPDELIAYVHKRFGPITDDTVEQVISFAGRAISAGDAILALQPDISPPPIIVPVNEQLFGDDWYGKRLLLVARGEVLETGNPFDLWLDLPDFTPWGEIEELIQSRVDEFAASYPDAAKRLGLDVVQRVQVERLIAERRY